MPEESKKVSPEVIKAAMERYPGIPAPLAISKYMLDQLYEGQEMAPLQAGSGWGGVHLEQVGTIVQKLAVAMYHQRKKSITIKIDCEDFPFDWDHVWLEITKVDSGSKKEVDRMALAGWPCCACDKTIKGDDADAAVTILEKKAKWEYPTWGNVLTSERGKAIAALCGACVTAGKEPLYAAKKDGEKMVRVPVSELEDA